MFNLKDVLPEQHLLCRPRINRIDLIVADCKLLHFLKEYEKTNGEVCITPNLYLRLHLRECVENYGSIYGFWLFSFERYNGILGSYNTNNKTVEIQIVLKFMTSGTLANMQYSKPTQYMQWSLPTQLQSTAWIQREIWRNQSISTTNAWIFWSFTWQGICVGRFHISLFWELIKAGKSWPIRIECIN